MSVDQDVLRSNFDLEFTYTRTYGPILSKFFTALKNRKVLGIRMSDGKIMFPPLEYDPTTGESLEEFVELSDVGEVVTWAWVASPLDKHPIDRPFAWVLVKIDGTDSTMLHVLDVEEKSAVSTGSRVKICWAEEREGTIKDIRCFELLESHDE